MRDMHLNEDFLSGMIAGLACALVGSLVTYVVMAFKTRPSGNTEPPEDGNPFVEPTPQAPDNIPDWMLEEQS